MFHAPIALRVRKRSRPVEVAVPDREEVKFQDVRLYLVERKMGHSRRSFLTQLARSKGFIVEDVLRLEKDCHFVFLNVKLHKNTLMLCWPFVVFQTDYWDFVLGLQSLYSKTCEMEVTVAITVNVSQVH